MARVDNLQFLEDIIPKTQTYAQYKAKKAAKSRQSGALQNGQTTLDGSSAPAQRASEARNASLKYMEGVDAGRSGAQNTPTPQNAGSSSRQSNGQQYIFEHYEPQSSARRDDSGDVEMT